MSFNVIIPARLQSSRLPGKVLKDIAGKPMIYHTYQQALKSDADNVFVASDSDEVIAVADDFGATTCKTDANHSTGTDRIAEACQLLNLADDAIVVNVQADEPLIPPAIISRAAKILQEDSSVSVGTLCHVIDNEADVFNPNVVKVVMDKNNHALYFSRATIPWDRDGFLTQTKQTTAKHYRHIGIYAYRVSFLKEYVNWQACDLESVECLEQLRVLWHGENIGVAVVDEFAVTDVNTEEDLERARKLMAK